MRRSLARKNLEIFVSDGWKVRIKAKHGSKTSRSYRHLFVWNHGRLLLSASSSKNSKSVGSKRKNSMLGSTFVLAETC